MAFASLAGGARARSCLFWKCVLLRKVSIKGWIVEELTIEFVLKNFHTFGTALSAFQTFGCIIFY